MTEYIAENHNIIPWYQRPIFVVKSEYVRGEYSFTKY